MDSQQSKQCPWYNYDSSSINDGPIQQKTMQNTNVRCFSGGWHYWMGHFSNYSVFVYKLFIPSREILLLPPQTHIYTHTHIRQQQIILYFICVVFFALCWIDLELSVFVSFYHFVWQKLNWKSNEPIIKTHTHKTNLLVEIKTNKCIIYAEFQVRHNLTT